GPASATCRTSSTMSVKPTWCGPCRWARVSSTTAVSSELCARAATRGTSPMRCVHLCRVGGVRKTWIAVPGGFWITFRRFDKPFRPCDPGENVGFDGGFAMRRFLLGSLSVFLLLFAVSPVVRACINDREVSQSEREFKSSYEVQPNTGPYSPTED